MTCFFVENITSWSGLLGSELKSIFQLWTHLEINNRSLSRKLELSLLSVTLVKKDISSVKSFALEFNLLERHWCKGKGGVGPEFEPWGTPAETGLRN